jgi:hypothetical protein
MDILKHPHDEAAYQVLAHDDGSFRVLASTPASHPIKAGPFICRDDAEDWVEGHRARVQLLSAADARLGNGHPFRR